MPFIRKKEYENLLKENEKLKRRLYCMGSSILEVECLKEKMKELDSDLDLARTQFFIDRNKEYLFNVSVDILSGHYYEP